MWKLLLPSLGRSLLLLLHALLALFDGRRSLRGRVQVLLATPLFVVWQWLTWAGFLLDEIFFRGYRNVTVRDCLFVLGPPRSGTTYLHRALAADERYTSFRAWECLFGLSVCGRRLALGLAALDRVCGAPLARCAAWAGKRLNGDMAAIHQLGLQEAEEDFLCLLPASGCFLLVMAFPRLDWLWTLARFDDGMRSPGREAWLEYYRACVQKHLYVAGTGKLYLAKNPSFSGMAAALLDTFPGSRVIACVRDPRETVPSQLSSLRPFLRQCGFTTLPDDLQRNLLALLEHYYLHLADVAGTQPGRVAFLTMNALQDNLAAAVAGAFAELKLDMPAGLRDSLAAAAREASGYRSQHNYDASEFGLSEAAIDQRFRTVRRQFGFATGEVC